MAEMPSRAHLFGVFVLSFAVVIYEAALTRVFAVVMDHHLAFLSVSLAVCGLGLGSFGLYEWRRRFPEGDGRLLTHAASAFATTSVLALGALLGWVFPYHVEWYWLSGALLLVPFTCAGVFLAEIFARFPEQSGRLYGADLVGAGAAAVGVLGALQLSGGIQTCLLGAVLGAVSAVLCADRTATRRQGFVLCGLTLLLFLFNFEVPVLSIPAIRPPGSEVMNLNVAQPLFVDLSKPEATRPKILGTVWDAFSRTDLVEDPVFGPNVKRALQIYSNGNSPTIMVRVDGDLRKGDKRALLDTVQRSGLVPPAATVPFLKPAQERALFIGPGGGIDVLLALMNGVHEIEGVEINPAILPLMKRHTDFNGHLYDLDNVHVVTGEGRSYLQRSGNRYDLIFSALTQSNSGGQGMLMAESYIHTLDALRDYWAHLGPSGQAAFILQQAELSMRLIATAGRLLNEQGMSDAQAMHHIALLAGPPPYAFLVLLRRAPFTEADGAALLAHAKTVGLMPVHVPPQWGFLRDVLSGNQPLAEYVSARARAAPQPLDLSPTTDDRPFFLDLRPGILPGLRDLCIGAAVLMLLLSVLAVALRRGGGSAPGRALAPFVACYTGLGVGFMLIEIPLIQKLTLPLGYPTLALTVTLFALLAGGGIGSAASQRVPADHRLGRVAALACLGAAALTLLLSAQLGSPWLLQGSLSLRITVVTLALLLLGGCLGVPFPAGVRLLAQLSRRDVPWMWGINGVMSVAGSLAATIGAKLWGFSAVLRCGAAIYVGLGVLLYLLSRRARSFPSSA